MNTDDTKKIMIDCPSTMNNQVAQQCFLIGLKNLIYLNNGSTIVSYLDEDKVKTTALMDDNGAILIKFLKALQDMNKYQLQQKLSNGKTKKQNLEEIGGSLLTELKQNDKVEQMP